VDVDALAERPFTPISEWPGLGTYPRIVCAIDGGRRMLRERALFRKLAGVRPLEDRAFIARSFEDCYRHLSESLTSGDRMGMVNSVEVRFPFLGNEMVDFGLHLPMRGKYRRGVTKYLLKQAAAKVLPASIIRAKKVGFQVQDYSWRHTDPLLRGGAVAELFKWRAQDTDELLAIAQQESLFVFHLLTIELWARMHFRGETPEALGERLLALVTAAG
jgi:asparagine synthase (glutamine-hydrolysing)